MNRWNDENGEPRPQRKRLTASEAAGLIVIAWVSIALCATTAAAAIIVRVAIAQLPR